jgi:hypothetical protein
MPGAALQTPAKPEDTAGGADALDEEQDMNKTVMILAFLYSVRERSTQESGSYPQAPTDPATINRLSTQVRCRSLTLGRV